MKAKKTIAALACAAACSLWAAPGHRIVGSGLGGNSIYATDAYPGFDGLDDLPTPEIKETSWFLHVSRATPAAQFAYAQEEQEAGNLRTARRAYDALVREWPASPEAPKAQLALARVLLKEDKRDDAFEEFDYLLDFYARDCDYAAIVAEQYELANDLATNRRTFFGLSFTSTRVLRQHYEVIVRRAPGASYVPTAMLKIGALREEDSNYEEAAEVYAALARKHPDTPEGRDAIYLGARARMWVCRRLAYNADRCRETRSFLKAALESKREPPHKDEIAAWFKDVSVYAEQADFERARFYDSRTRTAHSARAAWERFLKEYPDSPHATEVRARISQLDENAFAK